MAMSLGIVLIRRHDEAERPFSGYLEEILLAEGFVSHEVLSLSTQETIAEKHLSPHHTILLDTGEVSQNEAAVLESFVASGGGLIAIRPPKSLAPLCGLGFGGATTGNGYVILEQRHPLAGGLAEEALQYHGQSDLCTVSDGEALAWLAVHAHRATQHPAVITRSEGEGRVAAFTYDLTGSTLTFHQGLPDRVDPGPDGYSRPAYRYGGQVDPRRLGIPQADLQQRFLAKLLQWISAPRHPQPRLWYFPQGAMAAALLTGDSDGCSIEDITLIADTVESYGGAYTTYIKESDHESLPPAPITALRERGHGFAPHIWCGPNPAPEEMHQAVKDQTKRYIERYGHQPLTHRGHCLIWVGWVEMARYLSEVGISIDTNFVSGLIVGAGYMTGSGLPMRFMDESGRFLPCSEQATQWEDDCHIEGTSFYSEGFSIPEAIAATKEMLHLSMTDYHTMINFNFHPVHVRTALQTFTWIRETAKYCSENGVPMVSGDAWVKFNEARRASRLSDIRWDESDLRFSVTTDRPIRGLTLLIPSVLPRRRMVDLFVDGEPERPTYELIDGAEHLLCSLDFAEPGTKEVCCRFAP